ncbi:hypothetical protein GCM10023085_03030 [Actinomadura viridis]|uniref:Lipoprotein n=1 Tax=Actinomadura viridis TaxID=58110 RepID=A0A931DP08_9ACTN|nr:hypothetical protein [Actinomadura viridis]MBG6091121.1 hypothetical protein [Actinomadura viridis]
MRRHVLPAVALVPFLVLGASACGGGGTGTDARRAATGDTDKLRAYARCMRAAGVDMPDPSDDGRVQVKTMRGQESAMKAAEAKCRHLMPNGGKPPKADARQLAEMRRVAQCMRRNGVPQFPDPDPDGGLKVKMRKGTAMDPDHPTYRKAEKACRPAGTGDPARPTGKTAPGLSGGIGQGTGPAR